MTLGEYLKELRGKRTLLEVSRATGIRQSALSNYENNYRIPRDENKKKIARFYKKRVDAIFFRDLSHLKCLKED